MSKENEGSQITKPLKQENEGTGKIGLSPASLKNVSKDVVLASSSDKVVDYINSGILRGRFVPGQRLVELDLTRVLKLSRGPIREALRRLDALGIVSREPHRGACVKQLVRYEATDLLQAIEPVSGLIARLAAEKIAQRKLVDDMKPIEEMLQPYLDGIEDQSNVLIQRHHFYDTLMKIGGNSQLPFLLPTMRVQLLRMQVYSYLGAKDRSLHIEEYAAISRAVLDGNAKRAEKLMTQHIRRMRQAVANLPDETFSSGE